MLQMQTVLYVADLYSEFENIVIFSRKTKQKNITNIIDIFITLALHNNFRCSFQFSHHAYQANSASIDY